MKRPSELGVRKRAFQSPASFPAKRLSLVAETEMNGLNKEITRSRKITRRATSPFVKHVS
jgi:hypothetical protein